MATLPASPRDLLPTLCAIAGAGLPAPYVPDGIGQSAALLAQAAGYGDLGGTGDPIIKPAEANHPITAAFPPRSRFLPVHASIP